MQGDVTMNPYDKGSVNYDRYNSGYSVGKAHGSLNMAAWASRRWTYAFRIGYSDGYFVGTGGKES
jgi:hypothetical protein